MGKNRPNVKEHMLSCLQRLYQEGNIQVKWSKEESKTSGQDADKDIKEEWEIRRETVFTDFFPSYLVVPNWKFIDYSKLV